jgi:hypothetical protein
VPTPEQLFDDPDDPLPEGAVGVPLPEAAIATVNAIIITICFIFTLSRLRTLTPVQSLTEPSTLIPRFTGESANPRRSLSNTAHLMSNSGAEGVHSAVIGPPWKSTTGAGWKPLGHRGLGSRVATWRLARPIGQHSSRPVLRADVWLWPDSLMGAQPDFCQRSVALVAAVVTHLKASATGDLPACPVGVPRFP